MKIPTKLRKILRENRRTYFILNVATYGALTAMFIATSLFPGLRERGRAGSTAFTSMPGLSAVTAAYGSGNVTSAALLTFTANLLFAAVLTTTAPSLIVPFFGVATTVARACLVGMWLAPSSARALRALIPHAPVVIIEIQTYVLAALGSVVLWRKTLERRPPCSASAWAHYRAGISDNAQLYLVITPALFVLAVYEAVEVIHLIPRLG